MSTSQQFAIRAAIAALMAAGTPVAPSIQQNREFALAEGLDSQVHVNVVHSDPIVDELFAGAPIDWDTDYEIKVRTRKAAGTEADARADSIFADAYSRVMGNQSFGGLAMYVTPGAIDVQTDEADTSVAEISARFTVRHRTANNVLT
jgi:hypothetical protein